MPVNIKGKQYVTVAERLTEARNDIVSIITEVIPNGGSIVVKATVMLKDRGPFTGTSSANPAKAIEKTTPYEVAETSAVGRALGFAGYGAVDSIASADEMVKATDPEWIEQSEPKQTHKLACEVCGEEATIKSGEKNGKPWTGVFCSTGDRSHTKWG